jgi:hypothetical protein
MSTGNQPDGPDLYFASGDNLTRRDVQQFDEGFSGIQADAYNVGPNETANFRFRQDSQGFPVINNYGTMNVIIEGNGGQRQRGWAGDGGVDWGYEQFCKDKEARKYDFRSDQWDSSITQMRPSDMRRQALLDDGRALDDLYRHQMARASFDRNYDGRVYHNPGQYSGISYPGQDRDYGYYPDGGSLYHKGMPWYVNDCFGNGHRHGQNGDIRAVRNILRSIVSLADDNHHRSDGYWDRGHGRGLSHLDRLVGNRWDAQIFSNGDYGPSYGNWRGRHHGGNDYTNKALPIISEIAMAAAAIDRNNDMNNYRPYNGGDNYYHERNQSMRVAMNREEALARRERQAERIRRNREEAMMRRELA